MPFALSENSKTRRAGIDPRLIEISDVAIKITTVDFGIPGDGGLRTAERQRQLFDAKASKCDGVNKRSKHQSGKALDFYAYVDGKASWKTEHLAQVACAFLQAASQLGYGLEWGGLFKPTRKHGINTHASGWDMPHIQLVD